MPLRAAFRLPAKATGALMRSAFVFPAVTLRTDADAPLLNVIDPPAAVRVYASVAPKSISPTVNGLLTLTVCDVPIVGVVNWATSPVALG